MGCFRSWLGFYAFASLMLGSADAQQSPQELQDAVAELGSPNRRGHGSAVLKLAGVRALPAIRAMLNTVGAEHEPEPDAVMAALFAIHRLGKQAVAMMPEVRHVYARASNVHVRNQAMWTLACLAATSGDAEMIEATRSNLRRDFTNDLDRDTMMAAYTLLSLGKDPSAQLLQRYLLSAGTAVTAAAAAAVDLPSLEEDFADTLHTNLTLALARPTEPWNKNWRCDGATGYLAMALHAHGKADANTARGLLFHWDPDVRSTGLAALTDTSKLTAYERLDIVLRLWDSERRVGEQALAMLNTEGVHGIVGLRALRAFARDPTIGPRAIIYRRAADSVLATCCKATTTAAAALLRAADRILQGEPEAVLSQPADADGARLFAELVVGCRGADDSVLPRLAQLAYESGALQTKARTELATAFVSCFATWSEPAWRQTALALAELGPTSLRHLPDAVATILHSRFLYEHEWDSGCAFITEAAIRAGKRATEAELRSLLTSARWHLALAAAAQLVQRNAATLADAPALRLLATTDYDVVAAEVPIPSQRAKTQWSVGRMYLRAMAAVALTQIGEDSSQLPTVIEAAASEFRVPEDTVMRMLLTAKNNGTLPNLAARILRDATAEFPIFE